MIVNVRVEMDFRKPTILEPLSGRLNLICDCGNTYVMENDITEKTQLCCITCPRCGLHFSKGFLTDYVATLFDRLRRRTIEVN
jgi:hypothetical protein